MFVATGVASRSVLRFSFACDYICNGDPLEIETPAESRERLRLWKCKGGISPKKGVRR